MSKASEQELSELHGVIARQLKTIINDGVPAGEGTAPASAAYFMAGLAMLKQNNITADANSNSDLRDLSEALAAKRKLQKGRMAPGAIEEAARILERDLDMGGLLQ